MKTSFRVATLVAVLLAGSAHTAFAQVTTFMFVPGVPGGSTDAHHVGWIDVLSLQQSAMAQKKGSACQVTIVKPLDIAGPNLWLAAVTAQAFSEIHIQVVRLAAEPVAFYDIKLQNAVVSSISDGGAEGTPFTETVVLSAQSIILSYFPQNPDGSTGAAVSATIPCN